MAAKAEEILDSLIARVGRVRRWLLALTALRIAALGLAFVSLYIGLYAWLDHHVQFGRAGRVSAFALLLAMMAAGLYRIIRVLRRDMTYAHAANYIESRHSFDQQLVAAVEYYEGKSDYPYSKALARQLVLQVNSAAAGCRFDSVVDRRQGYLLSGFILLCLLVVGFFVRQNVLYISSYLARLVRPFSDVQAVPVTTLESMTDDIVTGPDAPVTLTASVRGRVPPSVTLVLTRPEPNDVNDALPREPERIEASPALDAQGNTTFTATKSFDAPGRFEYRFETPDVRSDSHVVRVCELPAIKSITATIAPPHRDGVPPVPPYEQPVANGKLEVLPGSRVELKAQATMPLREATATGSNGRQSVQHSSGDDSFTVQFAADKASSLQLNVVSTDGLANSTPQELRIVLKSDEPPQFKLVSPEGDYLATDVASIPITFEVTDDFGLDSARLLCELPNGEQIVLDSASAQGSKQLSLAHTLELEQYDLHVGDGILFYATAGDIDTGQRRTDANGCSEVYFIEIRPYQQYWHPQPGGGQPGSQPGPVPEDLITVLEYTRAILKKTWTLAHTAQTTAGDRSDLPAAPLRVGEALAADVQHCARLLTKTRDDPEAGFGDGDKAVLNQVLQDYEQASEHLGRDDAGAALPPEQDAYRTLRKFIDELHLRWNPPQTGQSTPQETPERVKLQEEPQVDEERLENRLKEMQKEIEALARQEQSLKSETDKALQQEKRAQSAAQSSGQGSSSQESAGPSSDGASQGQPGREQKTSQERNEQTAQNDQATGKKQDPAAPQSASPQSGDSSGQSGQSSEGQGSTGSSRANAEGSTDQKGTPSGSSSSTAAAQPSETESSSSVGGAATRAATEMDARLRMLQAKQQALREQATQLGAELGSLPAQEYSKRGSAQHQAQEHLGQAVETMKQFEEKLTEARYKAPASSESAQIGGLADSAARRLAEAGRVLQRAVSGDEQQAAADQAQEMADQLARDAQAYDESLSDADKQQMLERLAAAERLLESMAGPQWAMMSSGGGPGAGHVYTKDPHTTPAEAARMLAQQFWSVALEARQRQARPLQDEPSDVEFFEAENEFFESAARFRPERVEK